MHYPNFSVHTLYRHFLLHLLLLQLPPEWIPVQVETYLLPHAAIGAKLHPLTPYLKNTPHSAITHLMCQSSFSGAFLHVSHPLAEALMDPNFDIEKQPAALFEHLPLIDFCSLYSLLDYTSDDDPPLPRQWLHTTLSTLRSESQNITPHLFAC